MQPSCPLWVSSGHNGKSARTLVWFRRERIVSLAGYQRLLSLAVVISHNDIQGGLPMRLSYAIRGALTALTVAALATAAYADSGSIRFNVVKAGFVIGGSAGGGTLLFHGRRYPLSIGGISYGFTFGAAATDFVGTVSNIRRPSDVNGVYGAAGAGAAIGRGAGGIVLTNQNGAVLTLSGRQAGLIVAADLNGLVITVR
jgi:hypothetical protein